MKIFIPNCRFKNILFPQFFFKMSQQNFYIYSACGHPSLVISLSFALCTTFTLLLSPVTHITIFLSLCLFLISSVYDFWPIPVADQSKPWICCHLLAGIAGSVPTRGMECGVSVIEYSRRGGLGPLRLSGHEKRNMIFDISVFSFFFLFIYIILLPRPLFSVLFVSFHESLHFHIFSVSVFYVFLNHVSESSVYFSISIPLSLFVLYICENPKVPTVLKYKWFGPKHDRYSQHNL